MRGWERLKGKAEEEIAKSSRLNTQIRFSAI